MTALASRTEQALREALLEAARTYADATDRGVGEPLEGLQVGARLRIAAKAWRAAERQASETNKTSP
jgi:hypothetical protein